jgi:hypothetical protein
MTEWEFLRDVAETAHTTGKRLWLFGRPHLVIWSLYGKELAGETSPKKNPRQAVLPSRANRPRSRRSGRGRKSA